MKISSSGCRYRRRYARRTSGSSSARARRMPGCVPVGKAVFLTEAVGDGGPDLGSLGNQRRPLSGVAFEILDGRHYRGILAL